MHVGLVCLDAYVQDQLWRLAADGTRGEASFVRISIVRPTELEPVQIQAWRAMQLETRSLSNPFLSPEFSLGVGKFRPTARIAVLAEGSEILGFFPFERRRFGVGIAIGAGLNNCQGVVHAPGAQWDPREVLRACKLSAWQFDNLAQDQVPFKRYEVSRVRSATIDLTDGFEGYRESFRLRSSQFLKKLERKARNLQRDFGDLHFVADSRNAEDLRMLMSWKSEQSRQNGWVDIFDRPWVVDLLSYLFTARNDFFSPVLSMLYVGGSPAAGQFGLRSGSYLAGWFTAYNNKFSAYSPGLIQFVRTAEALAATGVETYELGGADEYQERLKSSDAYFSKGIVTTGTIAKGAHRARLSSAEWARRQVGRFPTAYHVADRILRRTGRIA